MALNKTTLKNLMVAKIEAEPHYSLPAGTTDIWLQEFCDALADAIVTHITAAAVVNPGTLAITPSNITDHNGGACSGNGSVTTGLGTVS